MSRTTIHVRPYGRLGNRMLQYMAALKLSSLIQDCEISNVQLPEWGIQTVPTETARPGRSPLLLRGHYINFDAIIRHVSEGQVNRLILAGPSQRMNNFLPVEVYRQEFPSPHISNSGYGEDFLLINIRTGDIVDGFHPHYTLIPIDFYEELITRTRLRPVFVGEIEDNVYCKELRRRFPQALFEPSRGAIRDFEMIRSSSNIVLAVSTFSWLAAWLSHAKQVYMPVNGLFNPMQFSPVDLLPLEDDRYRFFLFPINYSVKSDQVFALHKRLSGLWREMTPSALDTLRKGQPRIQRTVEQYLSHFDEQYYQSAAALGATWGGLWRPEELREHYKQVGFVANLPCFRFNDRWYAERYPMAALEVGQGDYVDLRHHYVHVGAMRGYMTGPIADARQESG